MKNKSTKHALLASVLSIVMCFAMLIGSTFAWFTDEVKTGVNKIVAGNLDVEMEYAVFNEDGTFKEWKSVEGESLFDENALWKPGYTQVVYLKISNVGSLSLNYKLSVDVASEKEGKRLPIAELGETQDEINFRLSDYLKFGAVATEAENFFADRAAARAAIGENAGKLKNYSAIGSIKASEKDTDIDYVALVVYMPEEVGNEANHYKTFAPEITLGIKLFATQMVDEKDSFGNDYDQNAFQNNEQTPEGEDAFADLSKDAFEVKTAADLLKFADLVNTGTDFANKTVDLANDITLAQSNWTPIGTETTPFKGTFDGGDHTISGLKITEFNSSLTISDTVGLFGVVEGATIKNVTAEGAIAIEKELVYNDSGDPIDGVIMGNIGGICGKDNGGSTFDNCTNKVDITVKGASTSTYVGGILGLSNGFGRPSKFLNSTNNANITFDSDMCEESYVGGITSASIGSSRVTITNCTHNTEKTVSGGNEANNICNGPYNS